MFNYKEQNVGVTILMISDKMNTIKQADKVVVLKNGFLMEIGDHSSILMDYPEGIYSKMVEVQQASEDNNGETVQILKQLERALEEKLQDEVLKEEETVKSSRPRIRTRTIVDAQGVKQLIQEAVPEEELKKHEEADEFELYQAKQRAESYTAEKKRSVKSKLYSGQPKCLLGLGALASVLVGAAAPLFGWIFARLIEKLTRPIDKQAESQSLRTAVGLDCFYLLLLAVATWLVVFVQKYAFAKLSGQVTQSIRVLLYESILKKDIGWFDEEENGVEQLTESLEQDTQIINKAAKESLGPVVEGIFAFLFGAVIAFYHCWQISLLCLFIIPIIIIANTIQSSLQSRQRQATKDKNEDALTLCHDAINKYQTVQSIGHESYLVKIYENSLIESDSKFLLRHLSLAIASGFQHAVTFVVFGLFFFFGGELVNKTWDDEAPVKTSTIIMAIFPIMFGAFRVRQAMAQVEEVRSAREAAGRVYDRMVHNAP